MPLPIGNGEQRFNAADVVAAGGGVLVDDAALTPAGVDLTLAPLLATRRGWRPWPGRGRRGRARRRRAAGRPGGRGVPERRRGAPVNGENQRFDFTDPVPPLEELGAVHFIAIGGAGMSGVARVMLARGCRVAVPTPRSRPCSRRWRAEGAAVHVGHDAAHLDGVDTVVISSAIRESNVELADRPRARAAGAAPLPGARQHDGRRRAGSRSPAPTARPRPPRCSPSPCSTAGVDPSFAAGGELAKHGTNAHWGTGDVFVAEADESDGSFLVYRPDVAVVTNVQPDHLDFYGTFETSRQAYARSSRPSSPAASSWPATTTTARGSWPTRPGPRARGC